MQAPPPAWDSDAVLRSYLERETEPIPHDQHDTDVDAARLVLTKLHLNDLQDIHLQVSPRQSDTLGLEEAGASFRFKVLAWKTFQINQLPVELLQYIFRLIIRPRSHYKDTDLSRLRLTSVCRHWRAAALADPLLWNVIYFCGPSHWGRVCQSMHRAGNALLDIHISDVHHLDTHFRDAAPKISLPHIRYLLLLLSEKWPQVRAVSIALHDPDTSIFLLDTLSTNTQFHNSRNLEMLVIDVPVADLSTYRPSSTFPGMAPRLHYLNINGAGVDFKSFPWKNRLTKLSLSRVPSHLLPTSERFLEVLVSTPCLTSLTLDQFTPRLENCRVVSSRNAVRLLKLKTLVLGNLSGREIQFITSHFDAPNVRYLHLLYLTQVDDGSLAEFLEGRFPHVNNLFLEDIQFAHTRRAAHAFVRWLNTMPEVTYLRLADYPANDISLSWFCDSAHRPLSPRCRVDEPIPPCSSEVVQSRTQLEYVSRHDFKDNAIGYITKGGRRASASEGWKGRHSTSPLPATLSAHRDPLTLIPRVDGSSLPRADVVLSKLSHLCIENIHDTDIVALVDNRRRAGNPLSDLTLAHPHMLPTDVAARIAASGTKVHFLQAQDSYALMLGDYW